jgi:hypothetical protein
VENLLSEKKRLKELEKVCKKINRENVISAINYLCWFDKEN